MHKYLIVLSYLALSTITSYPCDLCVQCRQHIMFDNEVELKIHIHSMHNVIRDNINLPNHVYFICQNLKYS